MCVSDREERFIFQHYMRVLDSKYLSLSQEKMAKERERLLAKNKQNKK